MWHCSIVVAVLGHAMLVVGSVWLLCVVVGVGHCEHRQTPMLHLDLINKQQFCKDSVPPHSGEHSFWVIPGTILVEFEFCSKFCWNQLINLAGPSAKFDSSGIPGIAQILPDSGRNQWRTIKTSISVPRHEISPFLYNSNCSSTPWPNCKEVPETSNISSSPYCSAKSCQPCLCCCEAAILGVGC